MTFIFFLLQGHLVLQYGIHVFLYRRERNTTASMRNNNYNYHWPEPSARQEQVPKTVHDAASSVHWMFCCTILSQRRFSKKTNHVCYEHVDTRGSSSHYRPSILDLILTIIQGHRWLTFPSTTNHTWRYRCGHSYHGERSVRLAR